MIDARGNAVSWIQSVFHGFGSGVVVPGTGVLLNNRMTGFSLDPKSPNVLAPGKKPMHTLNTWMLFRGDDLWAVGGTPGGDVQVQTNLQTVTQMIDWQRSPQEAIESPKWHVPPDGPELWWKTACPWTPATNSASAAIRSPSAAPGPAPAPARFLFLTRTPAHFKAAPTRASTAWHWGIEKPPALKGRAKKVTKALRA